MKKNYINGKFLTQNKTGVQVYAYEMCKNLVDIGVDIIILIPSGKIKKDYDISNFKIKKIGFLKSHLWEQIELFLYLLFKRKSILINFYGIGPIFINSKFLTIHDLSFFKREWFSFSYYLIHKLFIPLSSKNAIKILTVSNFSKDEIINKLKINSKKVEVIYNSLNISKNEMVKNQNKNEKFILSVASLNPRKNLVRLIKAFEMLNKNEYFLYLVGETNVKVFGNLKYEKFKNNERIKFLGHISDKELANLYLQASLFVFPSLYEGFGIPPLEAMSFNCPVLVSDIPVFKEIYNDSAYFCNPYDVNNISESIKLLLEDKELREELKIKGSAKVKEYSWRKSAEKLKNILTNLND